ncbi:MAG: tagaturonate epimerase family protein [Deinococcota bacterium]
MTNPSMGLEKLTTQFPDAYSASLMHEGEVSLWLGRDSGQKYLYVLAPKQHASLNDFVGHSEAFDDDHVLKRCPLQFENATSLMALFPEFKPVPLGLQTSAGFGDRLGIATPGHVRALQATLETGNSISPIFAQQSIREMTRTKRTPRDVMNDATWGTLETGWRGGVGADADHLKTPEDIDSCVRAGFSFFTIDPGEHVDNSAPDLGETELAEAFMKLPWDVLETRPNELERHYLTYSQDVNMQGQGDMQGEMYRFTFDKGTLQQAAVKYGRAIAHVVTMYHHLESHNIPFELEVSVDETDLPTSHHEHVYFASELKRLGVRWVSLAPRFVGQFEKGIDYIGELAKLEADLAGHAAIAKALGPYKLSLHSGSDKFSVYPRIVAVTQGLVHLKTAGTSYLEALRVISNHDTALFKEILDLARDRFEADKKSYHISAVLANVPASSTISDDSLPSLLDDNDARQVLHVTFGSALDAFKLRIMDVLDNHEEAHYATLQAHFEKHLEPFGQSTS